jgi:diadenosine tetraphosphate (Ap4A) HIT family hydrolase
MSCIICDKHQGLGNQPPGGYLYEDDHWKVCHYFVQNSVRGQLVVESKRHFLDFSDMTHAEAKSYGVLMKRLYAVLKQKIGAERVYSLVFLEGVPHFHVHLLPRHKGSEYRGVKFISQEWSCSEEEAIEAANLLRETLVNTKDLL